MIRDDLKEWLEENASSLLDSYLDEELTTMPTGWTMTEKCVAHYGGEDQGSDYWTVWQFNHEDGDKTLIRVNGWYQSYNGTEYNDYDEVQPAEQQVVVYKKI